MACSRIVGRYPLATVTHVGGGLPSSDVVLGERADGVTDVTWDLTCLLMRNLSYSLTARRSISSEMTNRTTPMQEPAKTPVEVIFHDEARKHESIVFQFQSICGWSACSGCRVMTPHE